MSALRSYADLAAEFGGDITERNVRDWVRQYGWPHIKVGRTVRFTEEHVAAIIARHTVAPKAETRPAVVLEGQTARSARRSA